MVHSQYWPDLQVLVDSSSVNEVACKIVWFETHEQTKPPQSLRDGLRTEKQFQGAVKALHAHSQKKTPACITVARNSIGQAGEAWNIGNSIGQKLKEQINQNREGGGKGEGSTTFAQKTIDIYPLYVNSVKIYFYFINPQLKAVTIAWMYADICEDICISRVLIKCL